MELVKFFHRLWNPHCPHCMVEDSENKICQACEVREREIERLYEIINKLTAPKSVEPIPQVDTSELKPIETNRRRFIPYAVRQQMQEAADRRSLELLIAATKKPEEIVSDEKPVKDEKINEMERDILNADLTNVNNG